MLNNYASMAIEVIKTWLLSNDLATALSVILGLSDEPNEYRGAKSCKNCYFCCRIEIQSILNSFTDNNNTDDEMTIQWSPTFCF